ncbi:MAG TPA: hypothetical protein VHB23_05280 [Devosiaceae bacterium]|jgi:hypothetical protein|nr:hypothetical protein [Devosiaceae bacterium]
MRRFGIALVIMAVLGFALPAVRDAIPFRLPISDLEAVGAATIFIFAGMVAVIFSPRSGD